MDLVQFSTVLIYKEKVTHSSKRSLLHKKNSNGYLFLHEALSKEWRKSLYNRGKENTHNNFYFAAMKLNLKWLRGGRRNEWNVPETQAVGLPVQAKVQTPRGMKTQGIPLITPIKVHKRKIIKLNILYFLSFRIYFNEWHYLIKWKEVKRNKNFLIQNHISQNFEENVWNQSSI